MTPGEYRTARIVSAVCSISCGILLLGVFGMALAVICSLPEAHNKVMSYIFGVSLATFAVTIYEACLYMYHRMMREMFK